AAMLEMDAPMGLYFPAAGQYWLMFPREADTHVLVYTMTRIGQVGAWSRYEFPFVVEDWAIAGDSLYLRSGDFVHRVDDAALGDEVVVSGDPPVRQVVP